MSDPQNPQPSSPERRLAASLYNRTWELMEKTDRTAAGDAEMIHTAHASAYHWSIAPERTPKNIAVGEWQCARVYAILGMGESALYHARRCLELCETNGIGDYVLASAHEAMARAAAASDDRALFTLHYNLAEKSLADIAEDDDREVIAQDLRRGPWYGMNPNAELSNTATAD